MNKPDHAGFYWAKPKDYTWYPFIVEVSGIAPYLTISLIVNRRITNIDDFDNLDYIEIQCPDDRKVEKILHNEHR